MLVFVTVGSTAFDALVDSVLSEEVLSCLLKKGCTTLVVQRGKSVDELSSTNDSGMAWKSPKDGMKIEIWQYKQSLQTEYECADLIISHAGEQQLTSL